MGHLCVVNMPGTACMRWYANAIAIDICLSVYNPVFDVHVRDRIPIEMPKNRLGFCRPSMAIRCCPLAYALGSQIYAYIGRRIGMKATRDSAGMAVPPPLPVHLCRAPMRLCHSLSLDIVPQTIFTNN